MQTKRRPYDGAAPQRADDQMEQRHPDAEDDYPDDICQRRSGASAIDDLLAERPQRQLREFKTLQTAGDSNDRKTQACSHDHPCHGANEATEYEP